MGTLCVGRPADYLPPGTVGQWPPATLHWRTRSRAATPKTDQEGTTRTPGWHPEEKEAQLPLVSEKRCSLLPAGNILTCRQTLPMRRSVPHDTELKSIGAPEFDLRAFRRKQAVPRWKRISEGRRPKDRSEKGGVTQISRPGNPRRQLSNCQAGPTASSTPPLLKAQMPWGGHPLCGRPAGYLPPGTVGQWLPAPCNGGKCKGRRPQNRPGVKGG